MFLHKNIFNTMYDAVAQNRDEVMNPDAKYPNKEFFNQDKKENHPANMQRLYDKCHVQHVTFIRCGLKFFIDKLRVSNHCLGKCNKVNACTDLCHFIDH